MTVCEDDMPWNRRAEFVRDGIPADVYRRQIIVAQGLRLKAYRRLIDTVVLAVRTALRSSAWARSGAQRV
jgi:hypothetical protein